MRGEELGELWGLGRMWVLASRMAGCRRVPAGLRKAGATSVAG